MSLPLQVCAPTSVHNAAQQRLAYIGSNYIPMYAPTLPTIRLPTQGSVRLRTGVGNDIGM
jgi:hypothetical protein